MSEGSELDPMPTFTFEAGDSGAMRLTLSISDGTHVWAAVTPEDWEAVKARGDSTMQRTIALSTEPPKN